jgi:hypothetical protein
MDDEDSLSSHLHSKEYAALRSDLSAALSAFDRAQDWAVSGAEMHCSLISAAGVGTRRAGRKDPCGCSC